MNEQQKEGKIVMYDRTFPYLTLVQNMNKKMVAWVYVYLNVSKSILCHMTVLALTLRLCKLT